METSKTLSVAIVGGGIGGLCLAIGLLSHPHLKISIYEAAPAFSEIGAGVSLGPNAQRALAFISPLAERAFLNQATANGSLAFKNTFLEYRYGRNGVREGEVLAKIENATGHQSVHRAKLLDELVKLIPDGITHFDKRLVRVEELGSEQGVILRFADGSSARADCLLGADGIHSTVRKHVLGSTHPAAAPVFTNIVAYRGLVPMEVARESIGDFANDARMWCGKKGMVLIYPIDFRETLNVTAVRDNISSWNYPDSVVPVDRERCLKEYSGWGELPTKILQLLSQPMMWALLDQPPAPRYNSDTVAILGDAAHASTPFQGAGVGQAIEDALVLTVLFEHVKRVGDISPALTSYDAVRRPRSQKIVQTSRDTMKLYSFSDGIVNGDGELWKKAWDGKLDWIWDVDLNKQNEEALEMFQKAREGGSIVSTPMNKESTELDTSRS